MVPGIGWILKTRPDAKRQNLTHFLTTLRGGLGCIGWCVRAGVHQDGVEAQADNLTRH